MNNNKAQVVDEVVAKKHFVEKRVMAYPPVREADIFWEKRVWRIIDTREKMNLAFRYPEKTFFEILVDGARNGDVKLYSTEDDKFSYPLQDKELDNILFNTDTTEVINPATQMSELVVYQDELNYDDVKRYRLKEVWFFDSNYSTMRVRILGIAPLIDVKDDNGNFLYEKPLFWVYYPEMRELLARNEYYNPLNDNPAMSWEDIFEMRYFASVIIKESNIHDRRIQDYLTGVDALMEADKITQEIFNFEQDLWSY